MKQTIRAINRRDLLLIFILALLIRTAAALPQQQPNYMDAAYSYVNALNLAAGRGFVEDFVWNYLADPLPPPKPSHLYWMPLTSMMASTGMLIGGVSYRAAQIPFILLSALLAPLTYWIASILSGHRWQSWLAGLLMIFSGFYVPFWTAIDNFTPFALAGALALVLAGLGIAAEHNRRPPTADRRSNSLSLSPRLSMSQSLNLPISQSPNLPISQSPNLPTLRLRSGRVSQSPNLYLFSSGLFIGLAHLARADGPLLLVAIVLTYALALIRSSTATAHVLRLTFYALRFTLYLALGYFLVMSPWFIRNWLAVGNPFPTAGSQTIWLTTGDSLLGSYHDLFSYGQTPSAQTFFEQGFPAIIQGRWWAFLTNLQTVLAVWCMIFLLPLAIIGGWHLRRHILFQLVGLYALLLFLAMTLIFAFPGALGGLFHSGSALLPFIYVAAAVGLDRSVDWVAARRRHWRGDVAKRVFAGGVLIFAITISGFIYYTRVLQNDAWNSADGLYPEIAAWINERDDATTVMINNPPAYLYHGGGLSTVIPAEDVATTLRAAYKYGVDYLVLERNHPALLNDLYTQKVTHPNLRLIKTFAENSNHEVHIFQVIQPE